ncbi:MAG: response regulator [Patescibacteria group bacterium]
MTLQGKKIQFLDDNEEESIENDIFEQYNPEGNNNENETNENVPSNLTRPKEDGDRAWEDDFDTNDNAVDIPVSNQDTATEQAEQPDNFEVVEVVKSDKDKKWEENPEPEQPSADENFQTEDQSQLEMQEPPKEQNIPVSSPEQEIEEKKQEPKKEKEAEQKNEALAVKESISTKDKKAVEEVVLDPDKKTILIADDDVDTLAMYADVFENADYNVLRAYDGLEALTLIGQNIPDVIFTGIVMPRMDGFTLMESLNKDEKTANIPVVINSHLGRDADKGQAEELGARDFIIRGFTQPREVLERVGALLLKSDYAISFDIDDEDVQRLVKDLGTSDFLKCSENQKRVIKLHLVNEKNLVFAAQFGCVDKKEDK